MTLIPADLRSRLEADFHPVRRLPPPWRRTLTLVPFAMLALVAAPAWFDVRVDAARLGWLGGWGLSLSQVMIGLALTMAALREAIPGQEWSIRMLAAWILGPLVVIASVTWVSWSASPVTLRGGWWEVGLVCFGGSAATAMPAVAMASILAIRAYPLRPSITGALFGLGAGVMADAGWRMFCHFSEPAHVLPAHLGAVLASAMIGIVLTRTLARQTNTDPRQ